MRSRSLLGVILALYILLGAVYAFVTPPFEASDELWHYPMVRHLADGNPLPVQVFDPALAGPWKQEASQPPLYYYLGAALTFWIDTSDMDQVRLLNPHVDNGVITSDGNINLAIHDPNLDSWKGTLLAVRIVRLFSVLLGACTVFLTHQIAVEAMPGRREIALGAASVNAFLPMFLFISGSVNNDNLAIPLASLAVYLMIRSLKRKPSNSRWLVIGAVIGLALLAKEGTFALIPLAWGTIFISEWTFGGERKDSLGKQIEDVTLRGLASTAVRASMRFLLLMLPALLIAGWWYLRNIQLYGDFLGWSAFIAVLGQRAQPASLAQLWGERHGFMMSYWGLFGGVNVPMARWVYTILNGVLLVSVAGFLFFAVRLLRDAWHSRQSKRLDVSAMITWVLNLMQSHFGLTVALLFSAAVVYGLIQWATTTWSSQGRLVFTSISALCLLMAVGLAGWLPPRRARILLAVLSLFMFLAAASAPFIWLGPAYRSETHLSRDLPRMMPTKGTFVDGDQVLIKLTRFGAALGDAQDQTLRPGDSVDVFLDWQMVSAADREWSIFVHLVDPVLESPVAQRDMYPGQGLLSTRLVRPGEHSRSYMRLYVPPTAVSPARLQLTTGWYDYRTGERMRLESGGEVLTLQEFELQPQPGAYANPVNINFGDEMALVGYELNPRRVLPGDGVELSLQWRALRPLSNDYTFFAQLVDDDTTRWASYDLAPAGGTTGWTVGEANLLTMTLALSSETPPDLYPIHLGVYTRTEDGGFKRLQLVSEDGRITQADFLRLTDVRVD